MRMELTNEMIVCLTVYGMFGCGDGSVAYSDLVENLKDVMPEDEVLAHLDYLYDLGIIDRGPRLRNGFWEWSFSVSEEAEGFVGSAFARSSLHSLYPSIHVNGRPRFFCLSHCLIGSNLRINLQFRST